MDTSKAVAMRGFSAILKLILELSSPCCASFWDAIFAGAFAMRALAIKPVEAFALGGMIESAP